MQTANIVLKNASDVDVTFTPIQKNGLLFTYANLSNTSVSLREKVTLGLRPSKGTTAAKTSVRVSVPYEVEATDGQTVTKYVSFIGDFIIPSDAPTGIVETLVSFGSGVVINAQIEDTIVNEAFPY